MKQFFLVALTGVALFISPSLVGAEPRNPNIGAGPTPKEITIEPEQCTTRCYFVMGVPIYCYDICY